MMKRCTDLELGALLHAYELGALSEEDAERFELHTMKCEFCYNEVASLEKYSGTMRQSDLARKLAAREASLELGAESGTLWRYLWPKTPFLLRPTLLLLVILAMLYPAYRGLVQVTGTSEKARPVQMIRFSPTRTTQSSTFSISSGRDGVVSYSYAGAIAGREYEIAVVADDSNIIVRYTDVCTTDNVGRGDILLPLARMKPGTYRLIISDPSDLTARPQEYYFKIAE